MDEFVKLAPLIKLAPAPYITGDTVIVDLGGRPFYYGYMLSDADVKIVYPNEPLVDLNKDRWTKTFGVQSLAKTAEKIRTVIQLRFTDTPNCRWYGEANDYIKGKQLCGIKADITIIDKTLPAIIAKKTFTNNKLPDKVTVIENPSMRGFEYLKDSYQMYPFAEIEAYLKALPQK